MVVLQRYTQGYCIKFLSICYIMQPVVGIIIAGVISLALGYYLGSSSVPSSKAGCPSAPSPMCPPCTCNCPQCSNFQSFINKAKIDGTYTANKDSPGGDVFTVTIQAADGDVNKAFNFLYLITEIHPYITHVAMTYIDDKTVKGYLKSGTPSPVDSNGMRLYVAGRSLYK